MKQFEGVFINTKLEIFGGSTAFQTAWLKVKLFTELNVTVLIESIIFYLNLYWLWLILTFKAYIRIRKRINHLIFSFLWENFGHIQNNLHNIYFSSLLNSFYFNTWIQTLQQWQISNFHQNANRLVGISMKLSSKIIWRWKKLKI